MRLAPVDLPPFWPYNFFMPIQTAYSEVERLVARFKGLSTAARKSYNPQWSAGQVDEVVLRILNRLIFIRTA